MESVHLNLPNDVARCLEALAAEAGMSAHDYLVQLVTNSVSAQVDDDLAGLIDARSDESNDVVDSPAFWAAIDERIQASRNS